MAGEWLVSLAGPEDAATKESGRWKVGGNVRFLGNV
jgi:hypothetical protein